MDSTGRVIKAAEKEDPRKSCWLCHTPEHAVQLRVCSGCHKVRLFTAKFTLIEAAQMCNVGLLRLLLDLENAPLAAAALGATRERGVVTALCVDHT